MNNKLHNLLQLTTDSMGDIINRLYEKNIITKENYHEMMNKGTHELLRYILNYENIKNITYRVENKITTIKKDKLVQHDSLLNSSIIKDEEKKIERKCTKIIIPLDENQLCIGNIFRKISDYENNYFYPLIDKNSNYLIISVFTEEKQNENKEKFVDFIINFYLYCGDKDLIQYKDEVYKVVNPDNGEKLLFTIKSNNLGEKKRDGEVNYNEKVCSKPLLNIIINTIMLANKEETLSIELQKIIEENNIEIYRLNELGWIDRV